MWQTLIWQSRYVHLLSLSFSLMTKSSRLTRQGVFLEITPLKKTTTCLCAQAPKRTVSSLPLQHWSWMLQNAANVPRYLSLQTPDRELESYTTRVYNERYHFRSPSLLPRHAKPLLVSSVSCDKSDAVCCRRCCCCWRLFTWSPAQRRASCTCLLCLSHWSSPLPPVHQHTHAHTHTKHTLRRGRAASLRGVRTTIARTAAPLPMYGGLKALNHPRKMLSKDINGTLVLCGLTDGQQLDEF